MDGLDAYLMILLLASVCVQTVIVVCTVRTLSVMAEMAALQGVQLKNGQPLIFL